jgi:hypothetical protein
MSWHDRAEADRGRAAAGIEPLATVVVRRAGGTARPALAPRADRLVSALAGAARRAAGAIRGRDHRHAAPAIRPMAATWPTAGGRSRGSPRTPRGPRGEAIGRLDAGAAVPIYRGLPDADAAGARAPVDAAGLAPLHPPGR